MVVKSLGGLGGDQAINIGVPAFQSTHLSNTGQWIRIGILDSQQDQELGQGQVQKVRDCNWHHKIKCICTKSTN